MLDVLVYRRLLDNSADHVVQVIPWQLCVGIWTCTSEDRVSARACLHVVSGVCVLKHVGSCMDNIHVVDSLTPKEMIFHLFYRVLGKVTSY